MLFRTCLLALAAAGTVLAQDPTPSPAASPSPTERDEEDFDIPVPLGMPVKGIKIPHRDENGKLIMTLEAETAQKLDETTVEMQNLKIHAIDDDGRTLIVELPHSIFNLQTRLLTGDGNTLIRREDFEITGKSVEFNTKTRNGTVRGNVKMIILTTDTPQ